MSESGADTAGAPLEEDGIGEVLHPETPDSIAEDIIHEIRLGHIEDDVSHVLEERLDKAGIELPPEEVDDLAEEIERDAST